MTPRTVQLQIDQGASFSYRFGPWDKSGFDLTGASARCQVRTDGAGDLVLDFASALSPISVDETDNAIDVTLTDLETRVLASGSHLFDVLVTLASGLVVKTHKGRAVVDSTVTQ